jgi:hypothetical protein
VLLIFGVTIRFKQLGEQEFFCPACGGDRRGVLEAARRWFALFFLPIIPMGEVGQRVRCTTCGSSFEPSVLDHPTTAGLTVLMANAVRALTAMVVGCGPADSPAMRAAAVATVRRHVPGYDPATLANDIVHLHPLHAAEYLAPLAGSLEPTGRERFLRDVVQVALAGGEITPAQRQLIDDAGRALGLTPTHVIGIITTAAAAPAPHDETT